MTGGMGGLHHLALGGGGGKMGGGGGQHFTAVSEDDFGKPFDYRIMKRLWGYVAPYRLRIAAGCVLLLLYTGAADSEGTLGGLVSLGEPGTLGRLLDQALHEARLCASDPLCAENHPWRDGQSLHAAACHACMFSPETSCERGNRYLDRSVLVETVQADGLAFFPAAGVS